MRTQCHHSFQGPEGNVMLTAIETRSVRNCIFPINHCETRKRRIAEMLLSNDNMRGNKEKNNQKSICRASVCCRP